MSIAEVHTETTTAPVPFSRRVVKLEHPANIIPIAHIVAWLTLLTFALFAPVATRWYIAVPLVVLLSLLNFSLTIGVLHMHTHRPLFVSRRPNRVIDVLCCLPSLLTAAEMREVHVLNHHRFDDGPGDVTSTAGSERGLAAVFYWFRYGSIVKTHSLRTLSGRDVSKTRRVRRSQFIRDTVLVVALIIAAAYFAGNSRFLLFYAIPFVVIHINIGYFAWLTHAPARNFTDDPSKSMNTVGNWLNFCIFNQGYHSVHHRYPGIHWSQIPDKLDFMRQVEPGVVVPYWMTINSTWRVMVPGRFLDVDYGTRWQAKLDKRLEEGSVRARLLPWFAWI